MLHRHAPLVLIASLLSLPLPAVGQCNGGGPCTVVRSGAVSDGAGGPFLSNQVYVVTGPINVPAGQTLTIQPGAIVKFVPEFSLSRSLSVLGRLVANGTSGQPMIFTSWHDDVGGDTNGAATAPAAGDWKGIAFPPTSGSSQSPNQMTWCEVRFGGRNAGAQSAVDTDHFTATDCTFSDGQYDGVSMNQAAHPSFIDCHFQSFRRAFGQVPLNTVKNLCNNTTANITDGEDYFPVWLDSGLPNIVGTPTWTVDNTLNQSGLVLMTSILHIPAGQKLTLQPGIKIKFMHSTTNLVVNGELQASGNSVGQIVLTTINDDIGGALLGSNGSPQPGDWKGVLFGPSSDLSSMSHVLVRYGGNQSAAAVDLTQSDITMDHVTVEYSSSGGLNLNAAEPIVSNCAFNNNVVATTQVPINAIPNFTNNTAIGNSQSNGMAIGGGTLNAVLTLGPQNSFGGNPFDLVASMTIGAAGHLTIDPDTQFRATGAHSITVDGTLTCLGTLGHEVVFTSANDPAYGSSPIAPAPGDWGGINLNDGADASHLDHVIMKYGGSAGEMIEFKQSTATVQNSTFEFSSGPSMRQDNASAPSVTGCSFDNNGVPPITGVPIAVNGGYSANIANNNTGGDYIQYSSSILSTSVSLGVPNSLNDSGVFVFEQTFSIGVNAVLTMLPGTALKLSGASTALTVSGVLECPTGPAWITSLADDLVGGDTNGDGPVTSPTAGDWSHLTLSNSTTPSDLTNVTIRYGGFGGIGMLTLQGAAHSLTDCTISDSAGSGLQLGQSITPAIVNCHFDRNAKAVDGASSHALQGFSNNWASNNAAGDYMPILFGGTATITPAMAFLPDQVFVAESHLGISSGAVITLDAGTIIKFSGPNLPTNDRFQIHIQGELHCTGTQNAPVVLTSIYDSDHGGATVAGSASPGDWIGLIFSSASGMSTLTHTHIRYAGHGGVAAVDLNLADVTFTECVIEKSAGPGIHANGVSAPTITGGSITCNAGKAIAGLTWATLGNITGLSTYGNGGGDVMVIDSPIVTGDIVVYPHSYIGGALQVDVSPAITWPNSLTFMPGVVIKAGDPSVEFDFDLRGGPQGTARNPVVFTSLHDDAHGGDTNGSNMQPAPGDWMGLKRVIGQHALVRYGGASGAAGINDGSVEGCRVEHCSGIGFEGGGARNSIAWSNGGAGFWEGDRDWCTSAGNTGRGIDGASGHVTCSISWGNIAGDFPPLSSGYGSVSTPTGWIVIFSVGTTMGPCNPPVPIWGLCNQWGYGNANINPQFVDLANGDLRLQPSSPVRNVVPLSLTIPSGPNSNFIWDAISRAHANGGADFADHPRVLDDDFGGPGLFRPDLGAYESSPWELIVLGQAQLGTTLQIAVAGPPGSNLIALGFPPVPPATNLYLPGLGWYFGESVAATLPLGVVPSYTPLPLPMPSHPAFAGLKFVIQALATENASGRLMLTNAYFGETW